MALPSYDELYSQTDECISCLKSEEQSSYRKGSLLDFVEEKPLPLIVVPDLHAREYFLHDIMQYKLPEDFCAGELTAREALEAGAVRVVCVGDALHSEMRGRRRWLRAWADSQMGIADGEAMKEEMAEGLGLLLEVMRIKCKYPALFHFLKGNHENIRNREGGGDYQFYKFANEGAMTNAFMRTVYSDDVVRLIGCFEDALPLAAAFPRCVVSHAEPMYALTKEEVINARMNEEVVYALTWTANGEAEDGSAKALSKALGAKDTVYITGHRPVLGKYNFRQGKDVIQIHNPDKEQAAFVHTDRKFDAERDVIGIRE